MEVKMLLLVFVLAALGKTLCVSVSAQSEVKAELRSVQVGALQQLHFL